MKERELRQHASCSLCGRKLGESGVPLFYRLTVEQFHLDLAAIQRQQGLAMQLGGHGALAAVMGPDQDMAHQVGEPTVLTVCQPCAVEARYPVMYLLALNEQETDAEDEAADQSSSQGANP